MTYKYTSERNFTRLLEIVEVFVAPSQILRYISNPLLSDCQYYIIIVVYTAFIIPCNLTTGTPRPLCSNACYHFRHSCDDEYKLILTAARSFGIPISDDFSYFIFLIPLKILIMIVLILQVMCRYTIRKLLEVHNIYCK